MTSRASRLRCALAAGKGCAFGSTRTRAADRLPAWSWRTSWAPGINQDNVARPACSWPLIVAASLDPAHLGLQAERSTLQVVRDADSSHVILAFQMSLNDPGVLPRFLEKACRIGIPVERAEFRVQVAGR